MDGLREPLDVCDHLQRRLLDHLHALAVRKLAKVARCTNDQINAINSCLNLNYTMLALSLIAVLKSGNLRPSWRHPCGSAHLLVLVKSNICERQYERVRILACKWN